jgi:Protein of unknown function (DUF2695)
VLELHMYDNGVNQALHSILTRCLRLPAYECYVAHMDSASDDDLISSIAPDVMTCLGRCGFFEKLDGLMSPADNSIPSQGCEGSYKLSESILVTAGFGRAELDEIFAVLQSKGGCCDCEVLHNVAETSRLKANYWRSRAAGEIAQRPHAPHSHRN